MMNMAQDRIAALRQKMAEHRMDAYIIPSSDPHLGEYVPARWKSREWISGFNGSAGTVVVTADKAGLWTDSRYFLQAAEQLKGSGIELFKLMMPGTPSIPEFLMHTLREGATVGVDGQVYNVTDTRNLNSVLIRRGIKLDTSADLIGSIWEDRPQVPGHTLFELPEEIAGQSIQDKLNTINNKLRESGADCLIMGALDEIAWTFNIRGNDVDYNPVVVSYAFISENETVLFIQPGKLTPEIADHLKREGVILAEYNKIYTYISRLTRGTKVFIDPAKTNYALFEAIPEGCETVEGLTPANMLKSIKNSTELSGFRNAMVKDGVALTHFYYWLEKQLSAGAEVTEMAAAKKLSDFRGEQALYISDSFSTICGYADHGAIVHYSATPETDATIRPEGLLLMDSGAQYLDGTTDITRTIALGEPSEAMKKDYTRVLKGHISLAKCKFPAGTRGSQLDILARKALWDAGLNYLHGTGHGIGHCLNVHEGPQSIRMEENPVGLQEGMVISNEPGIYRANEYGIRTENLITVREDSETEFGKFLSFETLTLCYIDTNLVITAMLSARERAWLNKYHHYVYDKLSPFLPREENEWLKDKTKEI